MHPNLTTPGLWKPRTFAELLGPARIHAATLASKTKRILAGEGVARFCLSGPPGTGKTTLAELLAAELSLGNRNCIERKSGVLVTKEVVEGWMNNLGMANLWAGKTVRLINEMDKIPTVAQVLMLDYLDRALDCPDLAFIGTSNSDSTALEERFGTRFQYFSVPGPKAGDIIPLLMKWNVTEASARMIAEIAGGNVRQALLDLETTLDSQLAEPFAAAA